MVSTDVIICSPDGLHLRAAGDLAEFALRYHSSIFIERGDKSVSAKSLLGLLSLQVKKDTNVKIVCDGSDEQSALQGIVDFITALR